MNRYKGFTLIELLVVIAIIGILATLVITQVAGAQVRARNSQAKSDITEMGKAVELYKNDDSNGAGVVVALSGVATGSDFVATLSGVGTSPGVNTGTPTIPTLFSGTQTWSGTAGAGRYGAGITKTPSNSHTFTYKYFASVSTSDYAVATTVVNSNGVSDSGFCVKNGTSLNSAAGTSTIPTGC